MKICLNIVCKKEILTHSIKAEESILKKVNFSPQKRCRINSKGLYSGSFSQNKTMIWMRIADLYRKRKKKLSMMYNLLCYIYFKTKVKTMKCG